MSTTANTAASVASPSKCVVLVPVARYVEPPCEQALRGLERAGYAVRRVWGHSDIARGRSIMATEALADGFDELMWIDSDVVFSPGDVDRLRGHGAPLVGGVYPVKGRRRLAMTLLEKERTVAFGKEGGLIEVKHVATGFLYTHRSAYEAIRKHHRLPVCRGEKPCGVVPYFLSLVVEEAGVHSYLSEDFSFCYRARAAGIKVLADTGFRLGHVGSYTYSWEDAGRDAQRGPSFKMTIGAGKV
jgi:hypothetical protein